VVRKRHKVASHVLPNKRGDTVKLTAATVEKLELPPGEADRIFFDDSLKGFGLRFRSGGKRTWIVQYRLGSKQRRVIIGTLETHDVPAARKLAKDMLARVHQGGDPQVEKAERRAEAAETLGSLVDSYLMRYAARRLKPGTLTDVERYLRRHWAPLSERPARKVTRANVASRLADIAEESGGYAANRARAALNALYAWAIAEGLSDANPVVGTRKAVDEIARDRVLTDTELAAIWNEAGDGDFGAIARLLILTGQRREEVAAMTWDEVDLDGAAWRIGGDRTKNARAHEVPLATRAVEILRAAERRDGRDGRTLVFGSRKGPFSGWSKAKAALDGRLAASLGRTPTPWRLHDIRRTVATRMADVGVQPHVIEAVLNHVSGHKAGVAAVYNRASYANEKRIALNLWGEHVAALVEGRASNIVFLATTAG
jgi:integrase